MIVIPRFSQANLQKLALALGKSEKKWNQIFTLTQMPLSHQPYFEASEIMWPVGGLRGLAP
jgi:hypothetical protein